jgi:hypothetical protein
VLFDYADYQHLVKDFKEFAGATPAIWAYEDNQSPERILKTSGKTCLFYTTKASPLLILALSLSEKKSQLKAVLFQQFCLMQFTSMPINLI